MAIPDVKDALRSLQQAQVLQGLRKPETEKLRMELTETGTAAPLAQPEQALPQAETAKPPEPEASDLKELFIQDKTDCHAPKKGKALTEQSLFDD